MICRKRTFFTPRAPMLFAARGRGALLMMPRPLLRCQIKAEIKGFFAEMSFVPVLAMVLSQYWKWLEKINSYNFHHF